MRRLFGPLLDWLDLLRSWQAMTALVAIFLFEAGYLLWEAPAVVGETFDEISSGQLYYYHGPAPDAWLLPFLLFMVLQAALGRSLGGASKEPPGPRLWLWAVLAGVTACGWAAMVALVDYFALTQSGAAENFDYLVAENAAVSAFSVVILPLAVWQIAALQSGPRITLAMILRRIGRLWPLWLFNFALLQTGLNLLGGMTERSSLALFAGQPLWGYLNTNLAYAFDLVAVTLFYVAAFRAVRARGEEARIFA
jgi:hypothetical protein